MNTSIGSGDHLFPSEVKVYPHDYLPQGEHEAAALALHPYHFEPALDLPQV
jgi:hypothetical protein